MRQVEQILNPGAGNLLHDRRGGPAGIERSIVIPGGGKPIGGQRRGQRAADHPGKEPPPGGAQMATLARDDEFVDHLFGRDAGIAQRRSQSPPQRRRIYRRCDRSCVQSFEEIGSVSLRAFKKCAKRGHKMSCKRHEDRQIGSPSQEPCLP